MPARASRCPSPAGCRSSKRRRSGSPDPLITTQRLRLIPASLAFIEAELDGREAFARAMERDHDGMTPAEWPPELYDRGATEWMKKYLTENPDCGCWTMYCIAHTESRTLIGTCGYKGKPEADGTVEFGYGLLPAWHKRGLGTEAAAA